jgi:DNA-binding transcriptional MerR regulator
MQLPEENVELIIPDLTKKLFYKIGEVSRITKLEPYVLRYWEKEFQFLTPRKGSSGQRVYQKKDIEIILEIRRLLYNERFTIEGVRKKLFKNFASVIDINTRDIKVESKPKKQKSKQDKSSKHTKTIITTTKKMVIDSDTKEILLSIKTRLKDLHKTLTI